MGAYSELDIELRESSDAFEEDDSFYDGDGSCAEPGEPVEVVAQVETAPQVDAKPVSTPAPSPELADKAAAEDAKRKAHEEAEAKRKAEWEAKQQKKKEAEALALAKLDRLGWPHYVPAYPRTWMPAAEAKAAADYLGSEALGYEAIYQYQLEIRRDELVSRHRKETDPWDAEMALTPALPKDWDRWVSKVGIPENFMFYKYEKRGAKTGYCTYCEKDVPLRSKPHHNQKMRCPCCHHDVTCKSVGKLGWHLDTEEVCVYLLQPWPDGFVVREFWADKRYRKEDLKSPEVHYIEHWRVIYDNSLSRRTFYWGKYKQRTMRWISGLPSYSWMGPDCIYNTHGDAPGRVYGKTLAQMKRSALKQTGLLEWLPEHSMVVNPNFYLGLYKRIPQFEQIWKAGLSRLTDEICHDSGCMYGLIKAPDATSLTKALGIDRQGLKRLRRFNGGASLLGWLQVEKSCGKPIPDEVLQWFGGQEIAVSDLDFIRDRMTTIQICNYLQRQSEASQEPVKQVITTWRDYLSMADRLGMDTKDEIIYRVKLLRQRHDELVLRCQREDSKKQAAEVLKNFPDVDRICQGIKAKYEYANDKYAVAVPNGALDIIVEGAALCHCVGSSDRYWDRIECHEAYILFLRKASAPGVPYYTLEVEPNGTVRQIRTKFDRQEADIEEVKKFLAEWQKVVAKRLTAADQTKAETSRILRVQEFEQMRRDNVIIRAGDLAGHRLVDVLTADLMENAA